MRIRIQTALATIIFLRLCVCICVCFVSKATLGSRLFLLMPHTLRNATVTLGRGQKGKKQGSLYTECPKGAGCRTPRRVPGAKGPLQTLPLPCSWAKRPEDPNCECLGGGWRTQHLLFRLHYQQQKVEEPYSLRLKISLSRACYK